MADEYGRRLLADIEVLGFDEIINVIRSQDRAESAWLGCAQIDCILRTTLRANTLPDTYQPPIIEITSVAPQGGKTHLLYLLTSTAVTTADHGGREACVAILDADDSFNVHRLMQQIRLRLDSRSPSLCSAETDALIKTALEHVYILKPKQAVGLIATMTGLPEWFFKRKHRSLDRPMAFFAIDSINALNFRVSTSSDRTETTSYTSLIQAVKESSKVLDCPAILTTRYQGVLPRSRDESMPRSLRPDFASAWRPDLRLIVRCIPVRNIPSGLSTEEAARETADRMKIVALARFECVVNEYGLDPRVVQALYAAEDGFYFQIKANGLTMEAVE